jgi:hypothetical protein
MKGWKQVSTNTNGGYLQKKNWDGGQMDEGNIYVNPAKNLIIVAV